MDFNYNSGNIEIEGNNLDRWIELFKHIKVMINGTEFTLVLAGTKFDMHGAHGHISFDCNIHNSSLLKFKREENHGACNERSQLPETEDTAEDRN